MAPIDSQTTNWQCSKSIHGTPCGNGNVITKTKCKSSRCQKERGKGDLAMSIMDEVLGVFTSRDDVEYDAEAEAFGAANLGSGRGSSGGGSGNGNDSGYRPAKSAADEAQSGPGEARFSRRGRCT